MKIDIMERVGLIMGMQDNHDGTVTFSFDAAGTSSGCEDHDGLLIIIDFDGDERPSQGDLQ